MIGHRVNGHRVTAIRFRKLRDVGAAGLAGAAVLWAVAALPAPAWAAGRPSPYMFQPGARPVTGAATTSDARRLDAGATYRDSIPPGGKLFYRVDLDARRSAYVSAVAVPALGTKVAYGDKIKVSLQNRDGTDCGSNEARVGASAEFPRPLAAYASRVIDENASSCQAAGPYYVVIERSDAVAEPAGVTPERWDLELRHVSEPGLDRSGPTRAPENWPSASPGPLVAVPERREGGTSFFDAEGLSQGEWAAGIDPGESLFYRVPVDWGQQLFAAVDLGSSEGTGYVSGALSLALYNPALGLVAESNPVSYDGRQKTTSLAPLPPVAYENRFDPSSGDREMRFAGWYFLRVSLSPEVGAKFGRRAHGLTLQVQVRGEAKSGPGYAGAPGPFDVNDDDRDAAATGRRASGTAKDTMAVVAAGGIGAGSVLVLGLGLWTLLARRHAARQADLPRRPEAPGYGPPPAW